MFIIVLLLCITYILHEIVANIYIFFVAAIVNRKQSLWWPWSGGGGGPGEQRVRTRKVASQPFWRILWKLGVTRCTGFITKAARELARPWTRERDRDWKRRRWLTGIGGGGWQVKKKKKMTQGIGGAPDRRRSESARVTASPMTSEWFIHWHASVHQTIRSHLNQATQRAAARAQPWLISHDLKSRPSGRRDGGRPTSSEALLSSSKRTPPFEGQTFKVEVLLFSFLFGQKNDQILWGT